MLEIRNVLERIPPKVDKSIKPPSRPAVENCDNDTFSIGKVSDSDFGSERDAPHSGELFSTRFDFIETPS